MRTSRRRQSSRNRVGRRLDALRDLVVGVLFFWLIAAVNVFVLEPSTFGHLLRRLTYDWLQTRLALTRENSPTEVAVVDIAALPACPERRPEGMVFPRRALIEAVDAIIEEKPAAIGIDIDFSRGPNVWCDRPEDASPFDVRARDFSRMDWTPRGGPALFAYALKQPVPIYLGVFRGQELPRDQWLGAEQYAPLAAALLFPPEGGHGDDGHGAAVRTGERRYMAAAVRTAHDRLSTLSVAMARHARSRGRSVRQWLAFIVPPRLAAKLVDAGRTTHPDADIHVDQYLVDFSARAELRAKTSSFKNGTLFVPHGQTLRGKLVLMGNTDVRAARDKFPIPGTGEQETGVYWHAAGTDTLIRGVLLTPTGTGRLVLEAAFYFPILLTILILRLRSGHQLNVERLESGFTKISAGLVFVFGLLLVNLTRLMWDDFLLISVIVAMHPTLERWTHAAFRHLSGGFRAVWARTVAEDNRHA